MNPLKLLKPIGWAAVLGLAALIILLALWFAGGPARRDAAVARTGASLAASRVTSGAEATETIARGAQRDAADDNITLENSHAIDQAPGAGQRVDDAVSRAGAFSLCRRAAYRGSADCVQLLGPDEPSGARARR